MKRSAVVLLCAILALSSAACGKTGPDVPRQTEAMYRTYEYAYGNLNIQLPENADDPEDKGISLLFTDPENLWTLELKPLDVQNTKIEISNLDSQITPEHAYFKDVQENEDPYQDFAAHFWSLNFNMDNPGGMSMYYNEPKAFQVIDYGDTLVGQWGGLKLELTGLNKETGYTCRFTCALYLGSSELSGDRRRRSDRECGNQCRIPGTMEQYNKRDRYLYQFPGRQTWLSVCHSRETGRSRGSGSVMSG